MYILSLIDDPLESGYIAGITVNELNEYGFQQGSFKTGPLFSTPRDGFGACWMSGVWLQLAAFLKVFQC
jgi:hypothetical protein